MLYLYYSNRQERLAAELASLPAPADPLVPELVLVQNQGMAQWLTQELAQRRGISANVEYLLPAEFGWRLYRQLRPELPTTDSAFAREVLLWRVMALLPDCLDDPVFAPLARYLAGELPAQRRHQLAQRITDVYDQYLVYRPDWLLAWEAGESLGLGPEEAWQAALWRRLAQTDEPHRARLWQEFMELSDPAPVLETLPERFCVFGISSLPPAYLGLLRRVAEQREVHFFWLNPCREYWADIVTAKTRDRFENYWRKQGRPAPVEALEEGNPLLASLGKLGRDAFALHWSELLDSAASDDEAHFIEPAASNCLGLLQRDILTLTARTADERPQLAADDDSLTVHACHSPMREVQALYDELLARFAADPTLAPRDVLVMTPDIETYAPYIHAVFGAPEDEARRIPYTIADRTLKAESDVVRGFLALLECERGRFTAPAMFDLLQSPPVRARFGISVDELPLIEHWLRETGIRWGLDRADRARHGLPPTPEGTWEAGFKRLLLGYALPLGERSLFAGELPYDDIEGSDAETAGKLLAFYEALLELAQLLRAEHPLPVWCERIGSALGRFIDLDREADDAHLIQTALADLQQQAEAAGFDEPMPAAVFRQQLAGALSQRGRGGSFLVGCVTFAGMVPMRALPFRFIGLLGLNDADYPRRRPAADFDLVARHPRRGDRVHRDEDRYLFLEALLSARAALYLSYVGYSTRDNSESQPSVILSELLDYLIDNFEVAGIDEADAETRRERLLDHWVRRHPLQPFSPRYFGLDARLHSHSERHCAVARTLVQGQAEAPAAFFDQPLPPPEEGWRQVTLEQLIRFFRHPTRFLLAERLGVRLHEAEELQDRELFELDHREAAILRARLLAEHQAGESLAARLAIHQARGAVPPGQMGRFLYDRLAAECEGFAERIRALDASPTAPLHLDLTLEANGQHFRLSGLLDGITSVGRVDYRYAEIKGRDWLDLWVSHLALQLCRSPEQAGESFWLDKKTTHRLRPLSAEEAREHLAELVGLYWQGLHAPLPLFPETACHYARQIAAGKSAEEALELAREAVWAAERLPESDDPVLQIAFRGRDPLDETFCALAERVFSWVLHYSGAEAAEEVSA